MSNGANGAPTQLRRARPWLGTLVEIQASGLPVAALTTALEAAFADIALIHRLMSFHDPDSDLSRLNRDASTMPVQVHAHTAAVLRWALRIADQSAGCFEPCIAPLMVESGYLPRPARAPQADPAANWRDVRFDTAGSVIFDRPLWLDLGGIAKGYAVDGAIERLRAAGVAQACVNAGGDLRVFGADPQIVELRLPGDERRCISMLEVTDAAVASSASELDPDIGAARLAHRHGTTHRASVGGCAVIVAAPSCVVADALTKCVLLAAENLDALLARHCAQARLVISGRVRSLPADSSNRNDHALASTCSAVA